MTAANNAHLDFADALSNFENAVSSAARTRLTNTGQAAQKRLRAARARLAAAWRATLAERETALLNHPEIADFSRGIVLEGQHQRGKWDDSAKTDFDWAAVAQYLLAKAQLNPPQNDGTIGKSARLHRLVALGALVANWHAAVAARAENS